MDIKFYPGIQEERFIEVTRFRVCPVCRGHGRMIYTCKFCKGSGLNPVKEMCNLRDLLLKELPNYGFITRE